MAKAPMVVDAVLAGVGVTLSANERTCTVNISGNVLTADELRSLADQLDRLAAAAKVFYHTESVLTDFAITYAVTESREDSIIIVEKDAKTAVEKAFERHAIPKTHIKAVYNKSTGEYVDF